MSFVLDQVQDHGTPPQDQQIVGQADMMLQGACLLLVATSGYIRGTHSPVEPTWNPLVRVRLQNLMAASRRITTKASPGVPVDVTLGIWSVRPDRDGMGRW